MKQYGCLRGTWILTEHAKHPGRVRCFKKVTLPLPPPPPASWHSSHMKYSHKPREPTPKASGDCPPTMQWAPRRVARRVFSAAMGT